MTSASAVTVAARCAVRVLACGTLLVVVGALAAHGGCAARNNGPASRLAWDAHPTRNVVNLGNLSTGAPPSPAEARLAEFLFGVEPQGPLRLLKPMDIAADADGLLIVEGAMQRVLRWTPARRSLDGAAIDVAVPVALCAAERETFVAGDDGACRRIDAEGRVRGMYRLSDGGRIGGVAVAGGRVWITNPRAHRVEVLDLGSGEPVLTVGSRGEGPGEFGLPLGICANRDEVFVADMLNARVQVFGHDGAWRRQIGGAGDRPGRFGRPRAVAVGPDDTVFVVDAAQQCVHAFTREGRAITTFGGGEDGGDALALPAGVAVSALPIVAMYEPPIDPSPDYFVLVSEQISRPGVRVFAWRAAPHRLVLARFVRPESRVPTPVPSPHWSTDACAACHVVDGARVLPIAPHLVDDLCLSCHDGRKASRESHPVGRPAITVATRLPEGWPTVEGRVGCITCHDIRRHCHGATERPLENAAMVRGHDLHEPTRSCTECHVAETWRANPHSGIAAGASETASCAFCHAPPQSPKAEPVFDRRLRGGVTALCLNCHVMHADPAPRGHLDASIPATMSLHDPSRFPLDGDRVSCATCHDPHEAADGSHGLRAGHIELCLACHPK